MSVMRPGFEGSQRTDVYYMSSVAGQHDLRGSLAAEEDGFQIDVVNEVPVGFFDFERIEACEAGGVIDKTIEAFEVLRDLTEHRSNLRHAFEICAENRSASAFIGGSSRFSF